MSLAISQLLSVCVCLSIPQLAQVTWEVDSDERLRSLTLLCSVVCLCKLSTDTEVNTVWDGQTQQDHSPVAGRCVARQNGIIADVNTGYNRTTSALSVSGTALLPLQGDLAAHWCQRIQPAIIAVYDGRSESNIDVVRIEFLFRGVHAAHYSYVNTFIKRHARVLFHNNAIL